jgi:non-specific serine/threonine protein kinase
LALVGSLVHKSLLHQQEGIANEPRFIFLETIHQYARERLDQSGEKNSIQMRHADYFLELTKRASHEIRGANQEFWSKKLRQEYDNLLVALEWSLSGDAPQKGLQLAADLSEFWYYEGPITDGDKWIDRALLWLEQERHPEVVIAPDLQSLIYNSASMMDFVRGNLAQGREWNQKALRIAQENNDKLNQAWALFWLSANSTDEPSQYQKGIEYCERALTLFSEVSENYGLAWGFNQLGEMTRLVGDYSRAQMAYENSLQICRQIGNKRREAIALLNLAYVALYLKDYAQANSYVVQGLRLLQELNLKYHSAIALSMLAGPNLALGEPVRAVKLLGASQAIFERMYTQLQPADQVEINAYLSTAREQLGQSAFDRAWSQGIGMSYEQAISFALEDKQEDINGRS